MEIIQNNVKKVYTNATHYREHPITNIIVDIIDVCNYNCYYCYNKRPRTNKLLDLNKLYDFCKWYHDNINSLINICMLGGEPTLHPDLLRFCQKITSTYPTVKCGIITNFSKDLKYYLALLNARVDLILSWHSLSNDKNNQEFICKVNDIPYHFFEENKIKISVMYEKLNIRSSLHAFDNMYSKFYKYMELSIVENNHLHGNNSELYNYSSDELNEFKKRIEDKNYLASHDNLMIKFKYSNRIENKLLSQTILNKDLVNFHYYKCMAGIYQIQIYFNGDIAPCDDLYQIYQKKVILGNIYDRKFDQSKYHFRICQLYVCTCPMFSLKERVFK